MAKLKIILGDLYHINQFQTIYTPINIGYMASYATKLFGKDVKMENIFGIHLPYVIIRIFIQKSC